MATRKTQKARSCTMRRLPSRRVDHVENNCKIKFASELLGMRKSATVVSGYGTIDVIAWALKKVKL